MPYRTTLRDVRARGPIRTVAGVCPDTQDFVDLVNEAQERLWRRGSWWDSEWVVRLCVHNHCITWPRWCGTARGIRFPNGPADMVNRWYSILGRGFANGGYTSLWSSPGDYWGPTFDALAQTRPANIVSDLGTSPVYNDITGTTGKLIRYYVRNRSDIGKTIRIFGLGYGNQPLQEEVSPGIFQDGITIIAAAPFGTNAKLVTKITSVTREATNGMTYLYSYDSTTQILQDLVQYEPSETNPRYRRSDISGYCNNARCEQLVNGQADAIRQIIQIEALVKLQFIPAVNDDDFLFIDVEPALKLGMQAVKLEEQNQDNAARGKWLLAIDELNMEDRDKVPSDQTAVVESVIGGRPILSPN